ncbi:phospholipase effector Tle1 domain-containing protein [Acinetobacter populi]|uniref:T6SS Phospholipase effector Tle1-like catalytic domain-containing protein n=1 Tax=Acinetobacter populi TaxID=1582270 RepID=A0A1Z9Z3A6_9GAMM|nr:DUF2235 domain-containing protein [Acinetobacter populi]OUY08934.1 hypothetical protein CAP51_04795 [Acinetobacter populi]
MAPPSKNKTSSATTSINQQAQSNQQKDSFTPVVINQATINVFFDGTKNNLYNIDAHDRFKAQIAKNAKDYESYTNAYSNVAHLYSNRLLKKGISWVYIEGMGSSKYQEDSTRGFAFGSGETGIVERAKSAFNAIQQKLKDDQGQIKPNILILNVFGFSRGAATARHFVHLAKTQPRLFKDWGISANRIRFGFIGIFDTVSSFQDFGIDKKTAVFGLSGAGYNAVNPDFDDDVNELSLDFRALDSNDKKITKVCHIVACDEYREYFSLTNIIAAIRDKYGLEILMNGAHSDIGGSYPSGLSDGYHISNDKLKNWFLDQGFYKTDNIKTLQKVNPRAISPGHLASRKNIPNDYHKISLKIMRLIAQQFGGLTFNKNILVHEQKIPNGILKELIVRQPATVIKNLQWGNRLDLCLKDQAQVQNLRHQYLHWSARKSYNGGLTDDLGYTIRLKNGLPYRKIHNG